MPVPEPEPMPVSVSVPVPARTVSVVIPVFNAAGSLPDLVDRLHAALDPICEAHEVILVNDASRDASRTVMDSLLPGRPWLRTFDLARNSGQHAALLCGIRAAQHDVIVTLDDDLQHPPEEVPKLLSRLDEGFDVVFGTPEDERHNLWRKVASRVTKAALSQAIGGENARHVSAFRAFRTKVREAFDGYRSPFVSIDVLLTWGTDRFSAVPVRHEPRRHGASNYTFRSLIRHAMNMMTGFSTFPLQVASVVGFSLALFGVGVLAWVFGRYLVEGGSVPGFPFLASIVAIFSGAQLFAIGVIGEYLARMHFRMMEKPAYTVREERTGGG